MTGLIANSLRAMGWRPSVADWGVVCLSCCAAGPWTCPLSNHDDLELVEWPWKFVSDTVQLHERLSYWDKTV